MLEIIRIIEAVMANLNNVETRGQTNLAYLYNSIDALKNLKYALENPVVTEEKIDVEPSAEENTAE
jgi:hypothetical protein